MGILNKNKIKIHINKKDNRDDSFKFLNLEVPKISLLFFAVIFILVIIFLMIIFKDKTKVLLTLFFMISLIFLFFNIKNKIKINRYYKQMSKCIEDCEKNNYIDIIDFLGNNAQKYEGAIKQDIEQIYIESKEVNNKDKEKLFDNFLQKYNDSYFIFSMNILKTIKESNVKNKNLYLSNGAKKMQEIMSAKKSIIRENKIDIFITFLCTVIILFLLHFLLGFTIAFKSIIILDILYIIFFMFSLLILTL